LVRERHRHAVSLLDVACGTGEHARLLTERYGYLVDGLDLSPDFVRIAASKLPDRSIHLADMTDFDLGCTYDAILCLFSSIGYVRTLENVRRTLTAFRRHLSPGGIVIVEPWLTPEAVRPGHVSVHTAESDSLTVCRMSHMEVDGRVSRVHFEYLIGRPEGIRHVSEIHELGLFTIAELLDCFRSAGFSVDHDPAGLMGRGLYVARLAA
jgi:SAM-dependent methyltransferase